MSTLRVAIVSTFYPNESDPYRAVFVRNLVVAMARRGVSVDVVSPVPYAPPWPARKEWRALRAIPSQETRDDIEVLHPRFVAIPRLAAATGYTYASGIGTALSNLVARRRIDILHAHCAYPDGVAIARLASSLHIPFVVTAHGSDINVYANRRGIRGQLRRAVESAGAVIAVSGALQRKLQALVPEVAGRIAQVPCCGFDPAVFHPGERAAARQAVDLPDSGRIVVFVGQLVPIKALDDLLEAWRNNLHGGRLAASDRLVLIGDGPLRARMQAVAEASDSRGTILLTGPLPQVRIANYLRAANLLCLPSLNEGMPNVVVEACATGIPVVATDVGGLAELVTQGTNGLLVPPSRPDLLAHALSEALVTNWDTDLIVRSVRDYTWDSLAGRNIEILSAVARDRVPAAGDVQ